MSVNCISNLYITYFMLTYCKYSNRNMVINEYVHINLVLSIDKFQIACYQNINDCSNRI